MIIVLSPAKTLDYEFESNHEHSVPAFLKNSSKLIGELKEKEPKDIAPVVAKTLIGRLENTATFDALVDSMGRLHKDSYIKSIEASVRGDHTDILDKIEAPTLVVVGEFDRLTSPELAKDIADQIPGAKLAIIKDAGHLSNIENSNEFNSVVLDFLLGLPKE